MTEENKLRTLKEFFAMGNYTEIDHYTLKELQEEAKKWITELEQIKQISNTDEQIKALNIFNNKHNLDSIPDLVCGLYIIPSFINHFFNLETEGKDDKAKM